MIFSTTKVINYILKHQKNLDVKNTYGFPYTKEELKQMNCEDLENVFIELRDLEGLPDEL